ncbi:hypothetical protein DHEL01_v206417 [Diaporthe helianthi]|uniref:Uncharacterized protein n=1 Tax=Diaporthe helianthi TaxID=158607 RepID=A0A2P5HY59_DIAHE|nr:hypothetical protein DHEL01_v206417 [Diaporthe helianthi]
MTDGLMIIEGNVHQGYDAILKVKQELLSVGGNKTWWHSIRGSTVVDEAADLKTYMADVVTETTSQLANFCFRSFSNASFTLSKGDDGLPILTPHSQALMLFNLTTSTTASEKEGACTHVWA